MEAAENRTAIVVFARSAEAEAKALGTSSIVASRLSELLLRRTLDVVGRAPAGSAVVLATDGPISARWLSSLAPGPLLHLYEQRGEGFEARILDALQHACGLGYERLVVVGIDTPSMSARDLERACERAQPVLGPSADGGFYLLGLNADQLPRLVGLPWCTRGLLAALRERFSDLSLEHCPLRADIDHARDLIEQRARLERLSLRILGRSLEAHPARFVFAPPPEPRSWRVETRLAPRGPPPYALFV